MKLSEIVKKLDLETLNKKPIKKEVEIKNGYIGDLLSHVMAAVKPNSIWMTVQRHLNIIGVAVMSNIPAIIICEGHDVPDNVVEKADEEQVAIFKSQDNAFQLAARLNECGIK